ncbi:hypothetical protein K4K56_002108 [Colletotrichum sp. SAR 10_98]|nr:hypothetical protein K4K56_002108 [Colletotrichum sp. SAR 10_98]
MSSQTHPITLNKGKRFDNKNLQGRFRDKIVNERKFIREKNALDVQSHEDFERFWKTTQGARAQYDAKREIGIGRVVKGMTSLAASANDILQDISPILDLVRNFGAPYGGMAIGTICFVFVTKIVEAYNSFISFCMEAFEFYTRGGLRRWFQSLQSNTYIDEQSALVQKSIVDVRLLREDLLNKNVDTVKNELREVKEINIC